MLSSLRPLLRFLFVLLFLAFVPGFFTGKAEATTTRQATVACSLCGEQVSGREARSTNSFGGFDIDTCPHPRGEPIIPLIMWSCGKCGFTGYQDDLAASQPRDLEEKQKQWLAAELPPASFPHTPWEKYALAARLAGVRQASSEEIGLLYLRAAWCCRYAGCLHATQEKLPCQKIFSNSEKAVDTFLNKLQQLSTTLEKNLSPLVMDLEMLSIAEHLLATEPPPAADRPACMLLVAKIYRKRGEHIRTLTLLDKIEALAPPAGVKDEILALRKSIDLERGYQARAVEFLKPFIEAGKGDPKELAKVTLIVADSCRRLGKDAEAETWFRKLLAADALPEHVENMATLGLKLMGKTYTPSPERLQALKQQREDQLFKDLLDPETGREAGFQLLHNPDAAYIPRLIALLDHADQMVQINAMTGLTYDDPRVIKAMAERIDREYLLDRIFYNFRKIANPAALPILLPLLKKNLSSWNRRSLIEAITAIGGPEATEALLEEARTAFAADSVQTFQDFDSDGSHHVHYCSDLTDAIGCCDDVRGIDLLDSLLTRAHEEFLARSAGRGLEMLTNQHFGFSSRCEPDDHTGGTQEGEKPIEEATRAWQTWWSANRAGKRTDWIQTGFADAGYRVFPASDATRLDELVRGLTAPQQFIRYNSWMELHARTGLNIDRAHARCNSILEKEFADIAQKFRQWLDQHRSGLTWDNSLGRFKSNAPTPPVVTVPGDH